MANKRGRRGAFSPPSMSMKIKAILSSMPEDGCILMFNAPYTLVRRIATEMSGRKLTVAVTERIVGPSPKRRDLYVVKAADYYR